MEFTEKVDQVLTFIRKLCPDPIEGEAVLTSAAKLLSIGCCFQGEKHFKAQVENWETPPDQTLSKAQEGE